MGRDMLATAINLLSLTRGHNEMGSFFATTRDELILKYDDVFNPIIGQKPPDPILPPL